MNTASHEHDWRIDPHIVLTSYPPKSRIVCTICGAVSSTDPQYRVMFMSDNPNDWEPYQTPPSTPT